MIRRASLDLPAEVAKAFFADLRAYHAEPHATRRDEIAARQLRALREHVTGVLRLSDVKAMFEAMRDHLDS